MKHLVPAIFLATTLATPALGGVYVTGSVAGSTTNIAYSSYQSQYSSGSIGFDIASILRLSYTYSQEDATNEGYTDPRTEAQLKAANALPANANDDPSDDGYLVAYRTTSRVIGNSVDLQLVLYKGDVFVPFVVGGVIHKQTSITTEKEGQGPQTTKGQSLGPQAGAGLGVRLNRQFSLKLSYLISPGQTRLPGEEKATNVWDKKVTFGLQYEL
jgi:hypothetical protein